MSSMVEGRRSTKTNGQRGDCVECATNTTTGEYKLTSLSTLRSQSVCDCGRKMRSSECVVHGVQLCLVNVASPNEMILQSVVKCFRRTMPFLDRWKRRCVKRSLTFHERKCFVLFRNEEWLSHCSILSLLVGKLPWFIVNNLPTMQPPRVRFMSSNVDGRMARLVARVSTSFDRAERKKQTP